MGSTSVLPVRAALVRAPAGIFAVKSAGTLSAPFITVEHSPAEAGKENPRLRGAGDSCWKLRLFFRWIVQGHEKLIECDIVAFAKDRN